MRRRASSKLDVRRERRDNSFSLVELSMRMVMTYAATMVMMMSIMMKTCSRRVVMEERDWREE